MYCKNFSLIYPSDGICLYVLFVDKFCSHWNITHDITDLAFKSVCIFNISLTSVCQFNISNRSKVWNMVLFNNKTPEQCHWRRSAFFIWTVFTSSSCASVCNFEQVIFCWERSYKLNLSKQDLFLHLSLQLLKLVLWYVS